MFGIDSDFEKEVIEQAKYEEIEVFAKLPEIRIPIPGGRYYNPDFAYVVIPKDAQGAKDAAAKFHLVIESKGYKDQEELRGTEKFKIAAAKKFFQALQDYQAKRPDSQVPLRYDTLFNQRRLIDVINHFKDSFKN